MSSQSTTFIFFTKETDEIILFYTYRRYTLAIVEAPVTSASDDEIDVLPVESHGLLLEALRPLVDDLFRFRETPPVCLQRNLEIVFDLVGDLKWLYLSLGRAACNANKLCL